MQRNRTRRSGRVLGIVVAERSLGLSVVSLHDGAQTLRHTATFRLPDGPAVNDARFDAQQAGAALGEFLKKESLLASGGWPRSTDVVFGVPARWMWCRGFRLPVADESTTRQMLWLAADEKLPTGLGPFALDYLDTAAGEPDAGHFVVGVPLALSERLGQLATAAGLRMRSITPALVALSRFGSAPPDAAGWHLWVNETGVELFTATGSAFQLRHLGSPGSAWAGNLRRALHAGAAAPASLVLWEEQPLDAATRETLRQSLGSTRLVLADARLAGGAAAAVAAAVDAEPNFIAPRLRAPQPPPRLLGRAGLAAAAVGVLVLLMLGLLVRSTMQANRELATLDAQLNHLAPAVAAAGPRVATLRFARSFRADGLHFLPCLGDLTLAVPADEQTYLTAFDLQRSMDGVISGRARTAPQVLSLLDMLNASGRFGKLHCRLDDNHRTGRGSSGAAGEAGVSFEMSFAYQPQHDGRGPQAVAEDR